MAEAKRPRSLSKKKSEVISRYLSPKGEQQKSAKIEAPKAKKQGHARAHSSLTTIKSVPQQRKSLDKIEKVEKVEKPHLEEKIVEEQDTHSDEEDPDDPRSLSRKSNDIDDMEDKVKRLMAQRDALL